MSLARADASSQIAWLPLSAPLVILHASTARHERHRHSVRQYSYTKAAILPPRTRDRAWAYEERAVMITSPSRKVDTNRKMFHPNLNACKPKSGGMNPKQSQKDALK